MKNFVRLYKFEDSSSYNFSEKGVILGSKCGPIKISCNSSISCLCG